MNKKLLTFLCLGLSISLAGCGNKNNSANTDTGSKTDTGTTNTDTGTDTNTDTNTDTTITEDRSDIVALYEAFEENNGVIDVIDYSTSYCFGNKAYYCDYGEEYGGNGYIVNGTQGTYEFETFEDEFYYGNIVDKSLDGSAIFGNVYTFLDLAWLGESVWEQLEVGKYTTTDVDTLDVIGFLDGWGDYVGEYIVDPLLTITEGTAVFTGYLDLTEYFGYDDYNEDMVITFSDLGNVHNALIEDKINNPVEQVGLSEGYDENLLDEMDRYAGGAIPTLGFSKESYYEADFEYETLTLYDLTKGEDLLIESIQKLMADGYEFDFDGAIEASGIDDEGEFIPFDGETVFYGSISGMKELYDDEENFIGLASVAIEYYSADAVYYMNGDEALNAYPDGLFIMEFSKEDIYSYGDVLDDISNLNFPEGFELTTFGFEEEPYLFTVENMDDYGWLYGCDEYFRVYNGYFDDAETAYAQLAVAETYLNSIGLVTYTGYSASDLADGAVDFMVLDKEFNDGTILELQFSVAEDGGVGIVLMY